MVPAQALYIHAGESAGKKSRLTQVAAATGFTTRPPKNLVLALGKGVASSGGRAGDTELTAAVTLHPRELQWAAQTGLRAEARSSSCCR